MLGAAAFVGVPSIHRMAGPAGTVASNFYYYLFFVGVLHCTPPPPPVASDPVRLYSSCPPVQWLWALIDFPHATIAQLTRRTVEVLCRLASGSIYTSSVMKYNAFQHFTKYLEKIIKTQLKTSAAILFERLPIYNSSCMLYSDCSAGGPTDLHT